MPHLALDAVSIATPDGNPLFSDLSISIEREAVGLFGRNGSGKTTLLNAIAGYAALFCGTISVDGKIGILRRDRPAASSTVGDVLGVGGVYPLSAVYLVHRLTQ